ncbi:phosphoribosyltransferase family protein [uncultured Gulosibacter sp.]|uniref:ComF family protein n=1 Tax=uncultured Gulosibacter sp. TaxID=1339167 RepID=UPI00288BDE0F|nr:phosphoribosyltransferase family protein [uncultured Gulosibacter sp.]
MLGQRWVDSARDALGMLFPVRCAGCGRPDRGVCAQCRAALGTTRPASELLAPELPLVTSVNYDERIKRIIDAYKERGRVDAAAVLAPLLRQSIAALVQRQWSLANSGGLLLVPVPSTRAATARRGYDHLQLLAQRALPRAKTVSLLRAVRKVQDQSTLSRDAREQNLHAALVAHPSVAGQRCIVIDDLVTTGATVREAVRALRTAGGKPLGVAAIARVVKHYG